MQVFLKTRTKAYDAVGEYNEDTNGLVVKAGSKINRNVLDSKTFQWSARFGEIRNMFVSKNQVQVDVQFSSPSSAANFVSGGSKNGLDSWKLSDGRTIKQFLKDSQSK